MARGAGCDRQGAGVTGGSPLGFDVGAKGAGGTLQGLDLVCFLPASLALQKHAALHFAVPDLKADIA